MRLSKSICFVLFGLVACPAAMAAGPEEAVPVRVGVPTVLTGDLAVLGKNIANSVETYKRHCLRHRLEFFYEDAKKSSLDGLAAYQRLINIHKVDMLIGGTSSNGTLAGKTLVNRSKTVLITPLTGGSNIDEAGPYIFRIGNSDILNGFQQADYFAGKNIKSVALYTEETEYTQDIAKFFRKRFAESGGRIVFDQTFLPDSVNFRSEIAPLKAKGPQAIFMATQTGLAFGIFLKQLREQGLGPGVEIHTNFVAASNPDAHQAAGKAINGVFYMAPSYDADNPQLKKFFALYEADHGVPPMIAFHTAGTVDALNMLQDYLDRHGSYSREGFREYLLRQIKDYKGLMGVYSFDAQGNSNIGFRLERIEAQAGGEKG